MASSLENDATKTGSHDIQFSSFDAEPLVDKKRPTGY